MSTTKDLPPGWEKLLDDDEHILWQGRPSAAITYAGTDRFLTIFGIVFALVGMLLLAIAIIAATQGGDATVILFFSLFCLPFLAAGLYFSLFRVFLDARLRRHTHYTLTNKNGFIATDIAGNKQIKSYAIEGTPELIEGPKGAMVFFATEHFTVEEEEGPQSYSARVGFELIADGREVYRLIRDLQKNQVQKGAI